MPRPLAARGIVDRRAQAAAEAGFRQDQLQRHREQAADHDDHQPVAADADAEEIELALERRRQLDEDPRRSHDVVDRRHRHEGQADREQHLVEMAAGVEMAVERALQHHADRGARDKGQRQRRKERPAGIVDQYRADVAAGHGEGAMGEIDEIHQPERHRQPAGEHEQQHAVGDTVEQDGEQRGHVSRVSDVRSDANRQRRHGRACPGHPRLARASTWMPRMPGQARA